jgi:drug/metabolite transporter (DMT)-like permease
MRRLTEFKSKIRVSPGAGAGKNERSNYRERIMSTANLLRLIALAAIWGGSFLFLRIGAPVLGPAVMIAYRVGFAALFLAIVGLALSKPLLWRAHWKHYLILGLFNSALPFLLFAFAARTLSASVLSVLNATAPIWGALVSAAWARQGVSGRTIAGLVLGMAGVALLVGFDKVSALPGAGLAIAAALFAALNYGIASTYARFAKPVEPFANAHGSMWAATLLVLPVLPFFPQPGSATIGIMGAVLALGVLCSGVAYLLYFRLIRDVGPTSALTVTFLNPLFGILWGTLFLHEVIGWYTVAGSAIVIVGTALVTGYVPRWLAPSPAASDT